MARRPRTSIRVKMTLLYGGMFFLAGALLILAGYLFVRHALDTGITELGSSPLFNLAHKLLPDKPVLLGGNGSMITVDEFRAQLVAEQQQRQNGALSDAARPVPGRGRRGRAGGAGRGMGDGRSGAASAAPHHRDREGCRRAQPR